MDTFKDSNGTAIPTVKLTTSSDWVEWIETLRSYATSKGLWKHIDPNREALKTDPLKPLERTTRAEAKVKAAEIYGKEVKDLSEEEIKKTHDSELAKADDWLAELAHKRKSNSTILNWIIATTDTGIYRAALAALQSADADKEDFTTREIIKALKERLAPSTHSTKESVRKEYQAVLLDAQRANCKPEAWYARWSSVYAKAQMHKLNEIQDASGISDFLTAVASKFAPSWGEAKLNELDESILIPQRSSLTLEQYGALFLANVKRARNTKSVGHFATLGDRSDQEKGAQEATPTATNSNAATNNTPANNNTSRRSYSCPCISHSKHNWKPETCRRLAYALTSGRQGTLRNPPNDEKVKEILKRYRADKFKTLRSTIEKSDFKWDLVPTENSGYPGRINAAVIDGALLKALESSGVYSTMSHGAHILSKATLLDNCGATHLVNDIELLEPGTFVPCYNDWVEAGTTKIPIIGKGTRVLRKLLNGRNGANTEDLVLEDVAVVEGFHVNIVSEARLFKKGVWYSGYDCSLRFGKPEHSVVLASMTRQYNLVFIEYKTLSTYSTPMSQTLIPSSQAGVFMLIEAQHQAKRNVTRRRRPTRDPPNPRTDSERLWHLRSGHLGAKALEALVWRARNVRIEGIKHINCEVCALTYAQQVISRRPPEHMSPRPFWRICWDLQAYPAGFDGSNWLFNFREPWSNWCGAQPLVCKSGEVVFEALKALESYVKRQFNLAICIMKSDNEKAVIPIAGRSQFLRWASAEGIRVELSPPFTHEPNGGAEQVGKQITNKSITMLEGAHLPQELWTESTRAAAYLINISPSSTQGMISPAEKLEQWFKTYAPLPIREHTADLRPDWSGVYAYGCRAYVLHRDREAGRNRRHYKTSPRGMIGYLVGYVATNLYRIWIPRLEKVMTTRNVTFDETRFYDPKEQSDTELTVQQLNELFMELEENESDESMVTSPTREEVTHVSQGSEERLKSGVEAPESIEKEAQSAENPDPAHLGLQTPRDTPERIFPSAQGGGPGAPESTRMKEGMLDAYKEIETPSSGVHSPTDNSQQWKQLGSKQKDQQSSALGALEPLLEIVDNQNQEAAEDSAKEETSKGKGAQQTRRSARIQGIAAPLGEVPAIKRRRRKTKESNQGVYSTLQDFSKLTGCYTLTDHQEQGSYDIRSFRTVFAVLDAAYNQKSSNRLGAAPNKPSIRLEDLAKPPSNWNELMHHPLKDRFLEAAHKEVNALRSKGTWIEINRENTKSRPLPVKWVFTYKFRSDGELDRCKARLVVRGDLQESATIESTYAATLAARTFRMLVALAARFDLELKQFDVKNAFLNAIRSEQGIPVTCELPDGFKQPGRVVELEKALYGLRDSPNLWFNELAATLRSEGLEQSLEEPCLFYTPDRKVFICFYVDDILTAYHKSDEALHTKIISALERKYELHHGGDAEWFLGIKIIRNRGEHRIYLSHDTYTEKAAQRFGLKGMR